MASPLTLLMPLSATADLDKLRKALVDNQSAIDNALKNIGTVHYARFMVFDRSSPNLEVASSNGPFVLAVITEYDGDFPHYIQAFVGQLGAVFDALLAFVDGGENLIPVQGHLQEFTDFIAANDASQNPPNDQFGLYSAYPYSVQKILAFK
jgi:hypothetical protein